MFFFFLFTGANSETKPLYWLMQYIESFVFKWSRKKDCEYVFFFVVVVVDLSHSL